MSYAVDLLHAAVYASTPTYFGPGLDLAVLGGLAALLFFVGLGRAPRLAEVIH